MRKFELSEIRQFMAVLLTTDTFDHFLVVEGSITTFCRFQIDGKLCRDFFDQSVKENLPEEPFVPWRMLRERFFSILKGKQSPLGMSLTCKLNRADTAAFLTENGITDSNADTCSLLITIRYQNGSLAVTSGVSRSSFSLDKSCDLLWDDQVETILHKNQLC